MSALKCRKRAILEQLITLLAPLHGTYCCPPMAVLGNESTVCDAQWPVCNEAYLVENTATYVVSFNGKARFNIELPADMPAGEVPKDGSCP